MKVCTIFLPSRHLFIILYFWLYKHIYIYYMNIFLITKVSIPPSIIINNMMIIIILYTSTSIYVNAMYILWIKRVMKNGEFHRAHSFLYSNEFSLSWSYWIFRGASNILKKLTPYIIVDRLEVRELHSTHWMRQFCFRIRYIMTTPLTHAV